MKKFVAFLPLIAILVFIIIFFKPPQQPEQSPNVNIMYFDPTDEMEPLINIIIDTVVEETGACSFGEIIPAEPYTEDDMDLSNDTSRASIEQNDPDARPPLYDDGNDITVLDFKADDIIILCYPLWDGKAPKIVSTLIESYDFGLKTFIPISISDDPNAGAGEEELITLLDDNTLWIEGRSLSLSTPKEEITQWIKEALSEYDLNKHVTH